MELAPTGLGGGLNFGDSEAYYDDHEDHEDDDDDETSMTPSSPLIGGSIGAERGEGSGGGVMFRRRRSIRDHADLLPPIDVSHSHRRPINKLLYRLSGRPGGSGRSLAGGGGAGEANGKDGGGGSTPGSTPNGGSPMSSRSVAASPAQSDHTESWMNLSPGAMIDTSSPSFHRSFRGHSQDRNQDHNQSEEHNRGHGQGLNNQVTAGGHHNLRHHDSGAADPGYNNRYNSGHHHHRRRSSFSYRGLPPGHCARWCDRRCYVLPSGTKKI